jgi:hypothetical protein
VEWPAGRILWRVARDANGTAFSANARRLQRFSPVRGPSGDVAPAWYGSTSVAGAIFESVFHDIRPHHRDPRFSPNAYLERVLVAVATARPLTLVDLTTDGLHSIGTSRASLIDSTSARYAWTVDIATELREAAPVADGFVWVSRARDTSRSLVLYADRCGADALVPGPGETMPLAIGPGLGLLRRLAEEARITFVRPDNAP